MKNDFKDEDCVFGKQNAYTNKSWVILGWGCWNVNYAESKNIRAVHDNIQNQLPRSGELLHSGRAGHDITCYPTT